MRALVSKYGKMYDALLNMPLNIEIDIAKEQVDEFVRSVARLDQENMRNSESIWMQGGLVHQWR